MKKFSLFLLVAVFVIVSVPFSVHADDYGVSPCFAALFCPNSTSHSGFYYSSTADSHSIFCADCDYFLRTEEHDLLGYVDCETGTECTVCSRVFPALGHSPSSDEMIPIDTEYHGYHCTRDGCYCNPYSEAYSVYGSYIPTMDFGQHYYLAEAYYEHWYHNQTGDRWHMRFKDCGGCSHVKTTSFRCLINHPDCYGGCDTD